MKHLGRPVTSKVPLGQRVRKYLATHRSGRSKIDAFHKLYYDSEALTWTRTFWLGAKVMKLPLDLWIYQEILWELKPDLIIECGTAFGGSALFFASICDLVGHGAVVTIDVEARGDRPLHPRITYMLGSSTSDLVFDRVRALAKDKRRVMAILDSDHKKPHVLRELELYGDLVSPGSYLIVEDTNINGHPAFPAFGPGPMEAVREFLDRDDRFVVDRTREKLLLTFNPTGYLLRTDSARS